METIKRNKNKLLIVMVAFAFIITSFAILWQNTAVQGFASSDGQGSFNEEKQISEATLEDEFAEDRILIVMDRQTTMSFRSFSTADFSEIGVKSVEELTKSSSEALKNQMVSARMGRSTRRKSMEIDSDKFRTILCLTIESAGRENVLETIKILEQRSDIISAEPDGILHIESTNPNDTRFRAGDQWGLNGTNGINAPGAWAVSTGTSTVRVGVIDTGIQASHTDLAGRVNTAMSRDFSTVAPHTVTTVTDPQGHGTHVAGIIGAIGNNGTGVTGTAQNIELVSLRISPTNLGDSFSSHLVMAVNYATTAEIPILSNSNGTDNFTGSTTSKNALASAIDGYPGLFVTSAGNAGKNNDTNNGLGGRFPSNIRLPNIISVGAHDKNGNRSNWNGFSNLWGLWGLTESSSNYGATMVDIFAPGTDILSTVPGNKYESWNGTSMATPFVSGVAALILSHNEDLTTAEIRAAIVNTATPVSALSGLCVTGGRLNASAALRSIGYEVTNIGSDNIQIDRPGFSASGSLELPSRLNGRTVTQIGANAFANQTQLTNVSIPASVEHIGSNAFLSCTNLQNITFPKGTAANVPDHTTSYSNAWYTERPLDVRLVAGQECTLSFDYSNLSASTSRTNVSTSLGIGENGYTAELHFAKSFPNAASGRQVITFTPTADQLLVSNRLWCRFIRTPTQQNVSIDIKNVKLEYNSRLQTIGNRAFAHCDNLTQITLPSTMTSIGDRAFQFCSNLSVVDLSATSITRIEDYTFDTTAISRISFPKTLRYIGEGAFIRAFNKAGTLSSLVLPDCVSYIGSIAFSSNTQLTRVAIPAGVTNIDSYAFEACTNLQDITFPGGNIISVPDHATYYSNYWYTERPLDVRLVAGQEYTLSFDYANLSATTSRTNVSTSLGVGENGYTGELHFAKIFPDAASGRQVLTFTPTASQLVNSNKLWCRFIRTQNQQDVSIDIKNVKLECNSQLQTIGSKAFVSCTSLTQIALPSTVTSIGDRAFQFCSNLSVVDLSATSITRLEEYTFDTTAISRISFPDTLQHISNGTFLRAFNRAGTSSSLVLPNGLTYIDAYAFRTNAQLTQVVIPASVTNIKADVFNDCPSLSTVYYGGANASAWNGIAIETGNTKLTGAQRYYYSETRRTGCWRYVNGVPTVWV